MEYIWKTSLVYVDYVIIYSKNVREHIHHVDEILSTLRAAGVTLNVKKFHFFQGKVEYLGHMVTPVELSIDEYNVESLKKPQPPKTKMKRRSFFGLCNVYQCFIQDFTGKAHPLNRNLKKDH